MHIRSDSFTITGKVQDRLGHPVAGALIKVKDSGRRAFTSHYGRFWLGGLESNSTVTLECFINGVPRYTLTVRLIQRNTHLVIVALSPESPRVLESILILPSHAATTAGHSAQFAAMGYYSDGSVENLTESVLWRSSDTSVATVSNEEGSQGSATTLHAGSAQITAALDGLASQPASLSVSEAALLRIDVLPSYAVLPVDFDIQYTALGTYSDRREQDITGSVYWESDDSVAALSNSDTSKGTASTIASGNAAIRAIDPSGICGTATLRVL